MHYKLQLNLRQRAALTTAISFWENKAVKDRVKEFFKSCGKFKTSEAKEEWRKLTKAILDEWNKDLLPQHLEVELIHIVKEIGEKIYHWYQYIKYENESQYETKEEAINYIDRIHWTPYGSVDGVETLKASWLENPKLNVAKVYNISCSYALEEHINDLWNKIPKDIQDSSYNDIYKSFDRLILAYWKCRRDDDLPNFMEYFKSAVNDFRRQDRNEVNFLCDLNLSIEENMFRLSVHQGYYIAVKYFWNKLTKEEKSKSVLRCARKAIVRSYHYEAGYEWIGGYKKEKYAEICIFLMNQMTTAHKKLFFNDDCILGMLSSVWPWQELFITVLKDMLQYQDDNSKMICVFLDAITNKMIEDHELGYSLENSKYRSLLREAWVIVPGFIKRKIVQQNFISNLIDVRDMDSLKLILNDPEIAAVRNGFINIGYDSYHYLIVEDQFEILDQFIEAIFRSEEEKKRFKQEIKPDHQMAYVDKFFNLADKLLDWQCDTPEERQSTKKNIFPIHFCHSFIAQGKYDVADEFLNWKFESEEDRKKCKDDFKSKEFTLRRLYGIWMKYKTNIDKAKEKSTEFLRWFLESEDEITWFKKEQLFNIDIGDLIINYRDQLYNIWNTNDFLS